MEALQIPNNQITNINNWNNIDINFKWNTVALSLLMLNPFFHPTFFQLPIIWSKFLFLLHKRVY